MFQRHNKCSTGCLHGELSPRIHRLQHMYKKVTPRKHWTALKFEGILLDTMTFTCILKECTTVRVADKGKQIHDEIAKHGLLQNDIVLGYALVDMYVKCGAVSKVQQVHNAQPSWDVVSCTAVLNCFEMWGHPSRCNYLYMHLESMYQADKGKQIHENYIVLGYVVVDMYVDSDDVSKARQVLNWLPSRDVVSWNAHMHKKVTARKHWNAFKFEGIPPDAHGSWKHVARSE